MRTMIPVMFAAALMAAGPAVAQDTNNTAAAAPTAVDANAATPTDLNAATPIATNDLAAPAPEVTTTTADTSQQTTEKKGGSFPWGVLGLLGLIGLIPRKGRS